MRIIRDGREYTLTTEELKEAYFEQDAEYIQEGLRHYIEERFDPDCGMGIGDIPSNLTKTEIETLIAEAQPLLDEYFSNDEMLAEIYWNTCEYALKEAWANLKAREGELCEG